MSAIAARKARLALQQSASASSSASSETAKAPSSTGPVATPTKRKAVKSGDRPRGKRLDKKQTGHSDQRGGGYVSNARTQAVRQNEYLVEASTGGEDDDDDEQDDDDDDDSSIGSTSSSSSDEGEGEVVIDGEDNKKQSILPLESHKSTFSIIREGPLKNWHIDTSDSKSQPTLLLALSSGQVLTFLGKVNIQVMCGQCELSGARLTPRHRTVAVFAPQNTPLPLLRAESNVKGIQGYSSQYGFADDRYTVIVKIRSILNSGIDSIARAYPLFRSGLFAPRATAAAPLTGDINSFYPVFAAVSGQSSAQIPASWHEALQLAEQIPSSNNNFVCLLRGPKRVGKSTFSRQLLNRLISTRSTSVAYLETDLGQTEFGPPGLAAVYLFGTLLEGHEHSSDLIVGPSWTSLRQPLRAHFIGDVTPRNDPKRYLAAIADLIQHYRQTLQSRGIPLIVNTQGWIKGLGADLLQEIAALLSPSHIFELDAAGEGNTLAVESGRATQGFEQVKIIVLDPIPPSLTRDRGLNAVESRTVNLISHFYSAQLPGSIGSSQHDLRPQWDFSQSLLQQRPYIVDVQQGISGGIHILPIGASVDKRLQLMALNGSCVAIVRARVATEQGTARQFKWDEALAQAPPVPATSTCLALAIVRSIDLDKGQIHLLTPLSMHDVQQPTDLQDRICLVKGAIEVPIWLSLSFLLIEACQSSHHHHQHHHQTSGTPLQLEGVPLANVPYLDFPNPDAERDSREQVIGLERRKIRRNIMRRSQKSSMQAPL